VLVRPCAAVTKAAAGARRCAKAMCRRRKAMALIQAFAIDQLKNLEPSSALINHKETRSGGVAARCRLLCSVKSLANCPACGLQWENSTGTLSRLQSSCKRTFQSQRMQKTRIMHAVDYSLGVKRQRAASLSCVDGDARSRFDDVKARGMPQSTVHAACCTTSSADFPIATRQESSLP
jgi:hypothetical protein